MSELICPKCGKMESDNCGHQFPETPSVELSRLRAENRELRGECGKLQENKIYVESRITELEAQIQSYETDLGLAKIALDQKIKLLESADGLIESLETAARWIPVSEGLPSAFNDSGYSDEYEVTDGEYIHIAEYDCRHDRWEKDDGENTEVADVTHYRAMRPLPMKQEVIS